MPNKFPFSAMANKLERVLANLPRQMGVIIVSESDRHFKKESFYNEKWPARKKDSPRNAGRALLVDSGILRRSIRSVVNRNTIVVLSDVPYAKVHNQGLTVRKRTAKKGKSRRQGGATFKMPKRQFLGDASQLREKLNSFVERRIKTALKT